MVTFLRMAKALGIDKVKRFFDIIKFNGGIRSSLYKLYRFDDLKIGTLVGVDKAGNRYYENKRYFLGRSRWVEYHESVGTDYDATQIPAEWFGWLHYKADDPPTVNPRVKYSWMIDHTENLSGTDKQFTPYNTVPQKIQPWVPPKKK